MTDLVTSTTPKQMKTIITLLNLVKNELFITIDHAERCLEMFISERQSNASLQQFIQALQQIRGSLMLIEVNGATQLTDLMLQRALAIPTDAGKEWDDTLSVLSTSIFTLRRYLENFESYPFPLPELLLPAINELRTTNKQPPLPDSYFTNISLSKPPLPNALPETLDVDVFGRLRQMYQIGLLGLIKDENRDASLRMMSRSMDRLQKSLNDENAARLCWVTSAALEAFTDSKMIAYPIRKRLFSRVDQQLRKTQVNHENVSDPLLKDLLYIVSLDNALGIKAFSVFGAFNLAPLPYNNRVLEAEMAKLAGPSQSAICSFTAAVREELAHTQQAIDNFTSSSEGHRSMTESLLNNLEHLIKTLSLVGLQPAEIMLKEQIGILELNKNEARLSPSILDNLADVILHVEGIILSYETNASCNDIQQNISSDSKTIMDDTINQYLKQGRTLAVQESLTGISTAQQNIMGYVESQGDKQYLEKMPQTLNEIYGCLLFLNQPRAAKIIRQCNYYIDTYMLDAATVPDTKQLDNLADVLASLEFFMETGMPNTNTSMTDAKVLDLAEESLATLNVPDIAIPTIQVTNTVATPKPVAPAPIAEKVNNVKADVAPAVVQINNVKAEPVVVEINNVKLEIAPTPTATTNNTKSALPFATVEVVTESATINEPVAEFADLDFNLDDFSSFNPSFSKSEPEPKPELKPEPAPVQPQPVKQEVAVEPVKPAAAATPNNHPKLSLEPLVNESDDEQQKEPQKPQPIKKVEKDDDDDIKFTRPENWTLS